MSISFRSKSRSVRPCSSVGGESDLFSLHVHAGEIAAKGLGGGLEQVPQLAVHQPVPFVVARGVAGNAVGVQPVAHGRRLAALEDQRDLAQAVRDDLVDPAQPQPSVVQHLDLEHD